MEEKKWRKKERKMKVLKRDDKEIKKRGGERTTIGET